MAKLTLADLRALREKTQKDMEMRDNSNKNVRVVVSMGTCGIAAGARFTFEAFIEKLKARGLTNVLVSQTGCMGFCQNEPTIEVVVPEMSPVIYGKVDPTKVEEIIEKHIVGHEVVKENVLERPSIDIIKEA